MSPTHRQDLRPAKPARKKLHAAGPITNRPRRSCLPLILTPRAARFTLPRMTRVTSLIVSVAMIFALSAGSAGCRGSNRGTSNWMKSVNSIKPGTTMGAVRKKLGRPDSKREGETPLRPYPPIGSPEGVLGTLPAETRYEQWIYKRGDSHYHVFFARTATEPHKWEVIAVRSAPVDAVY